MTQRTDWGAWSIKIMEIKTMEQEKANMAARYEHEIPEGYEARIEGNKVIIELKENEDEKIRTRLIALVEAFGQGAYKNEMLAYLEKQKDEAKRQYDLGMQAGREEALYEIEKQKEQKPVEWSEEDEKMRLACIDIIEHFPIPSGTIVYGPWGECTNWLKSLRPQPCWKPSDEQMEALMLAIEGECPPTSYMSRRLEDLYDGLVNTFDVDEKYLGNNKIDETD